ncbi:MAG: universal stress protein [Desulforhopalus sp.]
MNTITEIVVPVDLEDQSAKVAEYAAYMAKSLSANLTLLHVVELLRPIGDMVLGATTVEEYNKKRFTYAREQVDKLLTDYPECKGVVVSGEIVDKIVEFAEEKGADLIIIGTHGSKGIEKLLLGSVAERVVKYAHCPTLVMNPYKHKGQ